MNCFVFPSLLLYGLIVPHPDIPGHAVENKEGEWLTAVDGLRQRYIVGADKTHWYLWQLDDISGIRLKGSYPQGLTKENADKKISKI